jgi:hypothetical protein
MAQLWQHGRGAAYSDALIPPASPPGNWRGFSGDEMAKRSSRFSLFAILAAIVAYAVSLAYLSQ